MSPDDHVVPVRDEPHHKVTLENEYVRLIDVDLPPGDTTLYHLHTAPSVVVRLSHATIVSQKRGEAATPPRDVVPGETGYDAYDEKALIHRVINQGASGFHVLDIELPRAHPGAGPSTIAAAENVKLAFEQKAVRVYAIELEAGKRWSMAANECAHLLVCISGRAQAVDGSGAERANHSLGAGESMYASPERELQIANDGHGKSAYVLLEVK